MEIVVRNAAEADLSAIAALHYHSRERLSRFIPEGLGEKFLMERDLLEDTEMFREQLADEDSLVLIAEIDGQFCGFLTAAVQPYEDELLHSPYLTIEFLEVTPDMSGRGVGSSLLQAVEACARERGIRNIDLSVWQDNPRAQSLYARLGYAPLEIRMYKLLD
ncbi:GNAT family N-acetyltransferase [bacterium]|nr:GNAT family N-acetyltransferase [bacterium]